MKVGKERESLLLSWKADLESRREDHRNGMSRCRGIKRKFRNLNVRGKKSNVESDKMIGWSFHFTCSA